jgi:hypothetical protein
MSKDGRSNQMDKVQERKIKKLLRPYIKVRDGRKISTKKSKEKISELTKEIFSVFDNGKIKVKTKNPDGKKTKEEIKEVVVRNIIIPKPNNQSSGILCPDCDGEGSIDGVKCAECGGIGTVSATISSSEQITKINLGKGQRNMGGIGGARKLGMRR